MNPSYLYHAFGVRHQECTKTEYKGNQNKTGNIVARFLSRHAVLTLNGFNSIKDLLSYFAKVVLLHRITK